MDKSTLRFFFNPPSPKPEPETPQGSWSSSEAEDSLLHTLHMISKTPNPPGGYQGKKKRPFFSGRLQQPKGFRHNQRNTTKNSTQSWLFPALLASITGLVLGFGILLLFTRTPDGPTVTHDPGATIKQTGQGESATGKTISLSGVTLQICQVGVFQDLETAKKGLKDLEDKGVTAIFAGQGPVRLLAGIAPEKSQLQPLVDQFSEKKVPYYVKEWSVPEQKVTLTKITDADQVTLQKWLSSITPTAQEGLQLSYKGDRVEELTTWNQKASTIQKGWKDVQTILSKSGHEKERQLLDTMMKQWNDASAALGQADHLNQAQSKWLSFYSSYDAAAFGLAQ